MFNLWPSVQAFKLKLQINTILPNFAVFFIIFD